MRADVLLVSSLCLVLASCAAPVSQTPTSETPTAEPPTTAAPVGDPPRPTDPVDTAPAAAKLTVSMASATLADDCKGDTLPPPPPAPADPIESKPTAPVWRKGAMAADDAPSAAKSKRRHRCEQTSMQLSISATPGAPVKVTVKKVEIFDETGKSLGEVTAREPTIWSETGSYGPWDERIASSGQFAVSYTLSQPAWGNEDRRNKTYVVKAVVSVGGEDQTIDREVALQREVIIEAPTSLPAMVKT